MLGSTNRHLRERSEHFLTEPKALTYELASGRISIEASRREVGEMIAAVSYAHTRSRFQTHGAQLESTELHA